MQINRSFLAFCRTIHIYLTMLGLFAMLGFGITGFTAYHETWFDAAKTKETESTGKIPTELLEKKDPLQIIEHVRKVFAIRGSMNSFNEDDESYSISYAAPGMDWRVKIEKETGAATINRTTPNFVAVINDLHRGRSSGRMWGWVIDISAGLVVLACITGFVLWLALPKRRKLGIASMFVGTAATLAVFYMLVPGKDNAPPPPKSASNEHSAPGLFNTGSDVPAGTQPVTQPDSQSQPVKTTSESK